MAGFAIVWGDLGMDRKLLYFRKKIEAAAKKQGWIESKSMLAAVSGGGDSVALLWLLREFYKGRLAVVHLDHCTRNGESHSDAAFVRELCDAWNVDCIVKCVNVQNECAQGESFEMAARRVRYAFFEETADAGNFDFIAVGHNLDDLVETQLLNLFRGSGIEGLRGIPQRRGKIVRPLIDFRREELRELLRAQNVNWREDESNSENLYNRNKIRNVLIPWVKENLNCSFEISMAGLAREAAEYSSKKKAKVLQNIASVKEESSNCAAWDAKKARVFTESELADMLRLQGKELALPVLDRRRTEELVRLVKQAGRWRFQWAGDIEVCRVNAKLLWVKRQEAERLTHRANNNA